MSQQQQHDVICCVTTSRPSSTLTPSGGGGSVTMMCPTTGAIYSSLRTSADMSGKLPLGISSISIFPEEFTSSSGSNIRLAVAFGRNVTKSNVDTYAMLLSLRTGSSPAILHWKSRLPESDLTGGLIVSPCGHYIVGGGASGTCFVWSTLGGELLTSFKSHYRSCTCMTFSDCGRYVLTGGADGMLHVYSLMDLVDRTDKQQRTITPFHTWSAHHFPIKYLKTLGSGRVASSSEDGSVIIVEIFSQNVVASLQLPHGILCLDYYHDGRLYAGSTKGDIYIVNLNAYALYKATNQQGATMTKRQKLQVQEYLGNDTTIEQMVFGGATTTMDPLSKASDGTRFYQSELVGHDKPVTSLKLFTTGNPSLLQERLISGDEAGTIRIWDVESRTCLRVIQPWSHSSLDINNASVVSSSAKPSNSSREPQSTGGGSTTSSSTQQQHPVTSIQIISQMSGTASSMTTTTSSGMFGNSSHSQNNKSETILSLMTPLQRYPSEGSDGDGGIPIPFILQQSRSCANSDTINDWNVDATYNQVYSRQPFNRKKSKESAKGDDVSPTKQEEAGSNKNGNLVEEQRAQILELQKELELQKSQVQRWETINNKLMAKLNASKKSGK